MDGVEVEERDAVFNKPGSIPGCALGFTVTACLSTFVSHEGHMETFSWLKADRCTLSRAVTLLLVFQVWAGKLFLKTQAAAINLL